MLSLQNRVTPFGDIVASPGRGLIMGNRGVLHDDGRHIKRSWQLRRWIACRLEFRGRHREVMRPRRYTELFFLDEATAFSAGHRPCAECRNLDYRRFRMAWEANFKTSVRADAIDSHLHIERLAGTVKRIYRANLKDLPDGTYIRLDGRAWLVWDRELLAWSSAGYAKRRARQMLTAVDVLTPRSIVEIFGAGYRPEVHPSAML